MQFSLEKRLEKKIDSSNPPCQLMDCVIKWVIDLSTLQEIFHMSQTVYRATQQIKKY